MKTLTQKKQRAERQGGVALLFVVLLTSVLLVVAIGISNISYRELEFSVEARDSDRAFFAADTGIECALYLDKLGVFTSSASGNCGGFPYSVPASVSFDGASTYNFIIPTPDQCVEISVNKNYLFGTPLSSYTLIQAIGYNVSADPGAHASCLLSTVPNPNIVTRGLSTYYPNSGSGTGTGTGTGGTGGTTPPPPPSESVTTGGAASVSGTSEKLAGTATFGSTSGPVTVGFNYDTDADYSASSTYGDTISAGSLSSSGGFATTATGLVPCTEYDYEAYMVDAAGTTYYGANQKFTTSGTACGTASPPTVVILPGSTFGSVSVTVTGEVTSLGTDSTGVSPTSLATAVSFTDNGTDITTLASYTLTPASVTHAGDTFTAKFPLVCGANVIYATASNTNGSAVSSGATSPITGHGPCTTATTPTVTTDSGTSGAAGTTATISGTLNSSGTTSTGSADTASLSFLYSTTSGGPYTPIAATTPSSGTGTAPPDLPFSAILTGLTPCTTYYFEAAAANTAGDATGLESSVVTSGCPVSPTATLPTVTTGSVSVLSGETVNFTGTLNSSGTTSTGAVDTATPGFVYGTTLGGPYPFSLSAPPATAPPATPFDYELYTLTPCTTYYYEATATNGAGTAYGSPETFTTHC